MADVIGPNKYLPGQVLTAEVTVPCDNHPERASTTRLVGETDSFGSEIHHLCDECVKEMDEDNTTTSWCDHCGDLVDELTKPTRDPEEGNSGRVYYLCESHYLALRNISSED